VISSTAGKSQVLTFAIESMDPAVMALYFGTPGRPVFSVLIDRVEWVSGMPVRPRPRTGRLRYWDALTGNYRHALRLHAIREAAWVEAGCPKVPQTIRTYIPRASLSTGGAL
jgi:hypothetical protein